MAKKRRRRKRLEPNGFWPFSFSNFKRKNVKLLAPSLTNHIPEPSRRRASSAKALGRRSAKLFPHFRMVLFMRIYNDDTSLGKEGQKNKEIALTTQCFQP